MQKHLHIISFDIPSPPSYGGVIDIFYKIRALKEAGISIHLHCFKYGLHKEAPELETYCEEVHYYPRLLKKRFLFHTLPYIVVSRQSPSLRNNLLKDNHPILMEGLHSCYYLPDVRFRERKMIVRTHNIEHDYYRGLASTEKNRLKKIYFNREAGKLEVFEKNLRFASGIAAISPKDTTVLSGKFSNVHYIPAFHQHNRVTSHTGKGSFVLYHGNLGVNENNTAALYLVNKVFDDLDVPLVIAGSHPSQELKKAVAGKPHITLKGDISSEKIYTLIREAQINILPTFQATGIKLKLLAALYTGRHCLVNTSMVSGTGLESLCILADTQEEMKKQVHSLFAQDYPEANTRKREAILSENFSIQKNAENIIRLLF